MKKTDNILHVITISFVINHFFGHQFNYLSAKNNHKKYFLACSNHPDLDTYANELGFNPCPIEITRSINPIKDLIAIIKLILVIKKNKITKVVGHTPKGAMVAMIAGYVCRLSDRIYFRHGIVYETSKGVSGKLLKFIDKFSGFLATKVVCVSNAVKERSEQDSLNHPSKNIVLGLGTCNGIDTVHKFNPERFESSFKDALRKQLQLTKHDFILGYVGRIVKDKGIEELILAWKSIEKKGLNIKLLLVGPLERRDSISEPIKQLIISDINIIHVDFTPDASPYFSIMNAFILPTYREGFPTVALEASAMALPVIITKATGCTEAIVPDLTGGFISHDIINIKDTILKYYNQPDLCQNQGTEGRLFVMKNFEQTKIWDIIDKELNI
jgi:glycosyltransferase involved in cell wall biosynthesis